jgi:predicted nuclease with TOPRIM domain
MNTPIKQCCKDWIEVIDKQGNLIEQLKERIAKLKIENKQLQECFDECYEELQLTRNDGDKRIAELENQVEFEMGQKAIAREQRQRVISRLNSYLIKRANEIGECLPIYLVDHIKEFKGGAK